MNISHFKGIVQAAGVTLPEIHTLIADDLWERHSKMTNLTQRLESLDAERRRYTLETLARLPEELQSEHWWHLAPILDDAQLAQALGEHHAVHDEIQQARTFTALAPCLGPDMRRDQVEKHLQWTGRLEDESEKLRALAAVAPLLDETIEQRAVELALGMRFQAQQMKAIAILAPHLTVDRRRTAVAEARGRALEALADNNYEGQQLIERWAALMPFLSPPQRAEPLEIAVDLTTDQALPADFEHGVRLLGPFLTVAAVDRLEGYQWQTAKNLQLLLRSCASHLYSIAEKSELLSQIATLGSPIAHHIIEICQKWPWP